MTAGLPGGVSALGSQPADGAALAPTPGAAPSASVDAGSAQLISQVGQLTRRLHDTLRELGYHHAVERAADAVPDARQRLSYVAALTEQAATRTLVAAERARAMQDQVSRDAAQLGAAWEEYFGGNSGPTELWQLAEQTWEFLQALQGRTAATSAQLLEVVLAQEFQDLTGQVIRRVIEAAQDLEQQLLALLIDGAAPQVRVQIQHSGKLAGPVTDADGRSDVVTSQAQVDELLESLGF